MSQGPATSSLHRTPSALAAAASIAVVLMQVPLHAAPPPPDLTREEFKRLLASSLPESSGGEVVVVPLRGTFSYLFDAESPVIQPDLVACILEIATERKPAAVVVEIESPGGFVLVMDAVIENLLEAQRDQGIRVVAWPGSAYSAAALTTLSCREVVVRPGAIVGAATHVTGEEEAKDESAMDRKITSIRDARRREVAAFTGRPITVQDAMERPGSRLWHHPRLGFRDSPPPDAEAGWTSLDDDELKPMALHADELVQCGIAIGKAGTIDEVLGVLGIPKETKVVRLDPWSESARRTLDPALKKLDEYWSWAEKRYDRYVRESLIDDLKRVAIAIRAIEAQGAKDGWTSTDKKDLRRKVGACKAQLTKLDRQTKEVLERIGLLVCVETNLKVADDFLAVAIRTIDVDRQILSLGAIRGDLDTTFEALMSALRGCEDPEPDAPTDPPASSDKEKDAPSPTGGNSP